MTRVLHVSEALWSATWEGLRARSAGVRESACVWLGTRSNEIEQAVEIVFMDDLPGVIALPRYHRTSREAVLAMLQHARARGLKIVCDIHTHPRTWVDLSEIDQEHPIEYRVGLIALVLPDYGQGAVAIDRVGIHEYVGDGQWCRHPATSGRVRLTETP